MQIVPSMFDLTWNYPSGGSEEDLAREMGFDPESVLPQTGERLWAHTCAVYMSYCLLKCGIVLGKEPKRGSETLIRAGKLEGKHYWLRQHNLSDHLLSKVFGKPTYRGGDVDALSQAIGTKGGIVSFYSMTGYPGGHIDVVVENSGRHFLSHYRGDSSATFDNYASRTADIRFWRPGG